jgi:hypothetical protein
VFEPFSCVPVDVSFTLYPWEKPPQTQPGSFLHVWKWNLNWQTSLGQNRQKLRHIPQKQN